MRKPLRTWLTALLGVAGCYAVYALSLSCSVVLQGEHLVIFDKGVEYVFVDGNPVALEAVEGAFCYELMSTGGRSRIVYRYLGGSEQAVDVDMSLADESPSMVFHRKTIEGTFPYRRVK